MFTFDIKARCFPAQFDSAIFNSYQWVSIASKVLPCTDPIPVWAAMFLLVFSIPESDPFRSNMFRKSRNPFLYVRVFFHASFWMRTPVCNQPGSTKLWRRGAVLPSGDSRTNRSRGQPWSIYPGCVGTDRLWKWKRHFPDGCFSSFGVVFEFEDNPSPIAFDDACFRDDRFFSIATDIFYAYSDFEKTGSYIYVLA